MKMNESTPLFSPDKYDPSVKGTEHAHVETIHLHKDTADMQLVPKRYRVHLLKIITEYTNGFTKLYNDVWVPTTEP